MNNTDITDIENLNTQELNNKLLDKKEKTNINYK